jgi:hypothetical protein
LQIPLKVSGVSQNSVVILDGVKLTLKTSDGREWSRGWWSTWATIEPDDERASLSYEMKRQDYEKFRGSTVQVKVELAIAEFQEGGVSEVVVTRGPFRNPELGLCRLDSLRTSSVDCLKPLNTPGLMASFDPKQTQCFVDDDDDAGPEQFSVHAWLRPEYGDFPEPGISPLNEYSIYFSPRKSWIPEEDVTGRSTLISLCAGTKIRLANPHETRALRVQLHMDNISFDNLVGGGFYH